MTIKGQDPPREWELYKVYDGGGHEEAEPADLSRAGYVPAPERVAEPLGYVLAHPDGEIWHRSDTDIRLHRHASPNGIPVYTRAQPCVEASGEAVGYVAAAIIQDARDGTLISAGLHGEADKTFDTPLYLHPQPCGECVRHAVEIASKDDVIDRHANRLNELGDTLHEVHQELLAAVGSVSPTTVELAKYAGYRVRELAGMVDRLTERWQSACVALDSVGLEAMQIPDGIRKLAMQRDTLKIERDAAEKQRLEFEARANRIEAGSNAAGRRKEVAKALGLQRSGGADAPIWPLLITEIERLKSEHESATARAEKASSEHEATRQAILDHIGVGPSHRSADTWPWSRIVEHVGYLIRQMNANREEEQAAIVKCVELTARAEKAERERDDERSRADRLASAIEHCWSFLRKATDRMGIADAVREVSDRAESAEAECEDLRPVVEAARTFAAAYVRVGQDTEPHSTNVETAALVQAVRALDGAEPVRECRTCRHYRTPVNKTPCDCCCDHEHDMWSPRPEVKP